MSSWEDKLRANAFGTSVPYDDDEILKIAGYNEHFINFWGTGRKVKTITKRGDHLKAWMTNWKGKKIKWDRR